MATMEAIVTGHSDGWAFASASSGIVNTTTAVALKAGVTAPACNYVASLQIAHDALGGATPVFAKLSPDVTDIAAIARACMAAGADGLSMINTLLGMTIDTVTMRPALAGTTGGLSGPAIRPIAVRCIWQVRAALGNVPIIGMGGVRTGRDALELILAGAAMVSIGTTIFHDPSACARILRELEEELARRGIERLADIIGLAHEPHPAPGRRLSGSSL